MEQGSDQRQDFGRNRVGLNDEKPTFKRQKEACDKEPGSDGDEETQNLAHDVEERTRKSSKGYDQQSQRSFDKL